MCFESDSIVLVFRGTFTHININILIIIILLVLVFISNSTSIGYAFAACGRRVVIPCRKDLSTLAEPPTRIDAFACIHECNDYSCKKQACKHTHDVFCDK